MHAEKKGRISCAQRVDSSDNCATGRRRDTLPRRSEQSQIIIFSEYFAWPIVVAREDPARSESVEQRGGTKDGRLDNTRATLQTAVFRLDFISLTITATHPRCDLAAVSVVIDELDKIRRDC